MAWGSGGKVWTWLRASCLKMNFTVTGADTYRWAYQKSPLRGHNSYSCQVNICLPCSALFGDYIGLHRLSQHSITQKFRKEICECYQRDNSTPLASGILTIYLEKQLERVGKRRIEYSSDFSYSDIYQHWYDIGMLINSPIVSHFSLGKLTEGYKIPLGS